MQTPRQVYQTQLQERRAAWRRLERRHRILGYAKVAAVGAAIAFGFFSFLWVPAAAAVFIGLSIVHGRVIRSRERNSRAAAFYERGLARLDDRWMGTGESGERFLDADHPYAADLDLFGAGSLFELLCTARTGAGQQMLATWLREPASPDIVRSRQEAIAELRTSLDFRERLAVVGEEARAGAAPEKFVAWAGGVPALAGRAVRIAAIVLTLFAAVSAVAWANWNMRLPAAAAVLVNGSFWLAIRRRADEAAEAAEDAAGELRLFSLMLERFEREQFSSARLVELRRMLDLRGRPPSHRIARLHRLMELLESRHNWLVRLFDPLFFWTFHWGSAVESWRRRFGAEASRWLDVVAEVEALSALAGYSYEHPADPFPDFASGDTCFDADDLAHPLLPERSVVRNRLALGLGRRVLVVSGSNMSGKSTLLRAVGVNAVLAQCGAPVRAAGLRLTPLAIGASLRIVDSLQTGVSRFLAEIKRIRQIMDLTGGGSPVLFLLDELLQGTNSHDRRIGAEAIARALYERGAIGLLTTHDLALAEIVHALGPAAVNVHFEDTIADGALHFDYRLRPGVVTRSNALHLMRSVGLEV
ncbi:MAG: hypothetical protein KIT09_01605 [Bryobacteraceae bacterium]|nr:hypothetical protein [Bryobacteraceae bacterium]